MEGEEPTFDYWLAEKLHMTVREVREMDLREYVGWEAYVEVKRVVEELAARTEANRARNR